MPDMHIVDSLVGEARCDLLPVLLDFQNEREEALDIRGGDIVAVRALDEGLALEIEDSDEAGHRRGWRSWGR